MSDPLLWHRLQFAFTIIYHYLFPQLTMGLALLIVVLQVRWRCDQRPALGRRRALLGPRSSGSTSRSASSPACRWSSSSAPTGRASRATPAASSARRSRWRAVRVLPRVELPRPAPLRREAPRAARPLRRRGRAVRSAAGSRATSSSSPTPSCSTRSATRRPRRARSSSSTSRAFLLQPVGARAVRAHDGGRGRHRRRS